MVVRQGRGFVLHQPATAEQSFQLPVYVESAGTLPRVALTPFAVVGDTVMVGVAASVVGFVLWAQSGGPIFWR